MKQNKKSASNFCSQKGKYMSTKQRNDERWACAHLEIYYDCRPHFYEAYIDGTRVFASDSLEELANCLGVTAFPARCFVHMGEA